MPATDPPTVWPAVRYDDPGAGMQFLMDAFGFEQAMVVPGDNEGEYHHIELRWPKGIGGVMVGPRRHGGPLAELPQSRAWLYAVCDDPDALFTRATKAGAEVIDGLHDTEYGSRDFSVRDPGGNVWSFGTYTGT